MAYIVGVLSVEEEAELERQSGRRGGGHRRTLKGESCHHL
jgi:hypothetical protein